ncbi:MAG: tetratricopeptide repeat protein [Lentisphaeria bacterium]|nr:tetratricopeptide repeat protein [Lentisphaeria bacterium]
MVSRGPQRIRRGHFGRPWLGVACILLLAAATGRAIDEAEVDFDVLEGLNRLEFYDYAQMLLEQMESRHRDRLEEVLIEKARTFYACGKSKQADEALAQVKPSSPFYPNALILKAEVAAARGQNESSAKAYAEFFGKVKPPRQGSRRVVEAYTRAVTVYSTVLKRLGKAREAANVLELLANLEGASDRKLAFLKAQAVFDTEEAKTADAAPQALNRGAIEQALRKMEELFYLRDGIAAAAYLEAARGHVLLAGDELNGLVKDRKEKDALNIKGFREALRLIKMADDADLFRDIEKQVTSGSNLSDSPYAGALFYKAEAYRGLALAHYLAGEAPKARKLAEAAGKLFETVVTDYGESDYRMRALAKHGKCSAFLEKTFGTGLKLTDANVEAEMDLRLEQAQAFVQSRNYTAAIPIYMDAIRMGRRSKRLPDVAMRLILCLGDQGRYLEASAIGSYLVDTQPTSSGTAECLFRLGASMYENAKKLSGAQKEQLLAQAMDAWELFVETAADHSRAPEVAFAVAEHYYRIAGDLARQSEQATDVQTREERKAQAREAYLEAAPRYQRLVDRYSAMDKGTRALFKLGWIYYSTEQPRLSVEAFLRYSDSETLETYADDRLEAKFRAAEQMMLGEDPAEAVDQFRDLLAWLDAGRERGIDPRTERAKRIREDAMSYLAWAYDLAGEEQRPAMNALREQIAELEREQTGATATIRSARERITALRVEREDALRRYRDVEELLQDTDLDFSKAAQAEARRRGESSEGKSEEEKALIQRNVEAETQRLTADREARAKARVEGEKAAREEEREEVKAALVDIGTRLREQEEQQTRARQAREAAADALARAEAEVRRTKEAIAAVEKSIVQGENRARELEDRVQQLQQQVLATDSAAERQKLRDTGRAAAEEFNACRAANAEAYRKRDEIAGPEAQAALAHMEEALPALRDAAEKASEELKATEHRGELLTVEREILEARLRAIAKTLDANGTLGKALEAVGEQRQAMVPELTRKAAAALTDFALVRDLRLRRLDLLEQGASSRSQAAEARIAAVDEVIGARKEELKPLRTVFEEWKDKAQAAFADFLKTYPKSDHAAKNLSRLGTIYLELERYEQAESTLDRLAKEFPNSPATQEALFHLGRAQCEQGNHAEAASSFAKLLREPGAVNPANLGYISERMLDAGHADVSLAASRELIQRSADGTRPDSQLLRDRIRAASLFRAGTASLELKQWDDARQAFTTLLEENPRTGFFFDAKFGLAEAKRRATPPDVPGAMADLGEIIQYTEDPVDANRALCQVGAMLVDDGDDRSLRQAVARFQQVVLLADPKVPENLPWIEIAIVESAKSFARLGQDKEREEMIALYRERCPNGKRLAELQNLPTRADPTPAAPAGAAETNP